MPLSPRETEILKLIGEGLSNKEIAQRLGTNQNCIGVQCWRICRKLNVRDRYGAMRYAILQDMRSSVNPL